MSKNAARTVIEISPFGRNDGIHNREGGREGGESRNGFAVSALLLISQTPPLSFRT
jgi:hypothetical protein